MSSFKEEKKSTHIVISKYMRIITRWRWWYFFHIKTSTIVFRLLHILLCINRDRHTHTAKKKQGTISCIKYLCFLILYHIIFSREKFQKEREYKSLIKRFTRHTNTNVHVFEGTTENVNRYHFKKNFRVLYYLHNFNMLVTDSLLHFFYINTDHIRAF